jgi:hypothetical protein
MGRQAEVPLGSRDVPLLSWMVPPASDGFELPYDQLSPGIVGAIERAAYSAGQTLGRFSLFRDLRRSRGPAKEQ